MYQAIVVCVDGSDVSRNALRHALSIADAVGATVYVLTVVEPSGNPLAFGVDEVEELNHAIDSLVDTIVTAEGTNRVEIHSEVRRGQPPHQLILDYADEINADLIVLGRHGVTTLPHAVLGSTADRVARLAQHPVILIPADVAGG